MHPKSTKPPRRSYALPLVSLSLLFVVVLYANSPVPETTASASNNGPPESRELDPARSGRVAFSHFTDRNGLPQNAIQAMAFDRKGYLWAGTQDGAAYYNGRVWTVVNMPSRTTSNFVRCILVASDDSIWFGRQEGGVSRLKDGEWTTYDEQSGLPDKRVNALLETRTEDGVPVIWIGTDRGLAQIKGNELTRADARGAFPVERVSSLIETKAQTGASVVWVGTAAGLVRFSREEQRTFKGSDGLAQERISSLLATTDGAGRRILWIATSDGLVRFMPEENRWTTFDKRSGFPANNAVSLTETLESDGERILWVGTDGGGLVRYQGDVWTVFGTREGLPGNSVFSLLPSAGPGATEMLWIGTDGGGLARLAMGGWRSFTTANGLPVNSVFCIFESTDAAGRAMWFGTYGGGLARLQNGSWTIFDTSKGMPDNTVFEMLQTTLDDGQRVLWAGTKGGGLARFENGRWSRGEVEKAFGESTVRNMLATTDEAGARVVWVASGSRGLGRLYKNKWTFFDTTNGLPHSSIFELAETIDTDGTHVLWVATGGGGIARYSRGEWKVFDQTSGLPTNSVLSLHISQTREGKKYLWAGTEGGGVSRLELSGSEAQTHHWMTLSDTTVPALPNNTIYQIREDASGRIYLSHNKGVTRLTRSAKTDDLEYEVNTFTTEDGLPANEGNGGVSLVDSQGRIWVGTVGGAAVFDPAEELANHSASPLYIEHTLIGDKPRAFAEHQTLAHHENHLMFEYALLSFAHEEGTRYRTQLVGLEKEPSPWTGDSKKDFAALPAGDYIFKVWAKDYRGQLTEPASIAFTIKPAFWRTWLAIALYAGVVGGCALAGLRYRTKSLLRRNERLQAKVDERTRELAEKVDQLKESEQRAYTYAQTKSQFLANMSHEIRTPINGVIGMTSLLLNTPLNHEQQERAELVKRSGDMLLTIINDILDFSKIEAGKLELETIDFELTTAVEDVLELVARKAQVKDLELASFIAPDVPQTLQGDPIRLRQILINLVDNAIKFTEHGEVAVRVQLLEETSQTVILRCEVCDTGIGIKPGMLDNLFMAFAQADSSTTRKYGGTGLGLTIAKQLVELMQGEIGAESPGDDVPGSGSKFWFTATFLKSSTKPAAIPSRSPFHGRAALYAGSPGTQCQSILAQLAKWEIAATTLSDGASVLTTLRSNPAPDLLIVDHHLADMEGRALAQSVRLENTVSSVPIILLTPIAEPSDPGGPYHLLSKPMRRAQFHARLCEAFHVLNDLELSGLSGPLTAGSNGDALREISGPDSRALPTGKFRLLLVEDNHTNQQVAVSTLAEMGYRIETVTNGREAVGALQETEYDLVFMDCHMPEMDGFEATAEIRRLETSTRRTPIIAMTASALPEDRARCLSVGMDDYLAKPLDRKELRDVLERWLPGSLPAAGIVRAETLVSVSFAASPVELEALSNLRRLGGANESFLSELIDVFLQESVERLARMKEAAAHKDMRTVHRIAHTHRGACINFGAQQMAQLCVQLENTGSSSSDAELVAVHEIIARIEREFFRVNRMLEGERWQPAREV